MTKMVTITLPLNDALDAAYACIMRASGYVEQATASQPDARRTFDILAGKYDRIGKTLYVAINNSKSMSQLKEIA
jgi:hypothetical protein